MACNGICDRIIARKKGGFYYGHLHFKRCSVCCQNIYWSGTKCPCCGFLLRTRPRNQKNSKKLLVQSTELVINQVPVLVSR